MKLIAVLKPLQSIFQYLTNSAHNIKYNLFDQESFPLSIIFFSKSGTILILLKQTCVICTFLDCSQYPNTIRYDPNDKLDHRYR